MSEFKGPWRRPYGTLITRRPDGWFVESSPSGSPFAELKSLPNDAVPLVPEVLEAEEVPGDNDPYSEVNQQAAAWQAIVQHPVIGPISSLPERGTYADMVRACLDDVLAQLEASPSLPDVKSPEALRLAVEVLKASTSGIGREAFIRDLRDEADRLEREHAEQTARDAVIERAAKAIIWPQQGVKWSEANEQERKDAKIIARNLLDAGLLNTSDGSVKHE